MESDDKDLENSWQLACQMTDKTLQESAVFMYI